MKFAFYISRKSMRLVKFFEQATQDQLSDISCVISDYTFDSDCKDKLAKYCPNLVEFGWEKFKANDGGSRSLSFSNFLLEILNRNDIDYCFSFGEHILKGVLLTDYKNRIINFHPALLPMFPGLNAIDQAVNHKNVLLVGNTAHFIDEGMDTGPVIMQSVVPLQRFLSSGKDYNSVLDLIIPMLNQLIMLLKANRIHMVDGRCMIDGADYSKTAIFPAVKS